MTTVRLSLGTLRGTHESGVHSFKGVPYAEALQPRSRWQRPVPRKPWQGTRDATRYGAICMQFGRDSRLPLPTARTRYLDALARGSGTEGDDCLVLNVWTPSVDAHARLPVMVWIHGGGFTGGAANEVYDAAHWARQGVVCVTIQYRLGALGFLHGSGLFPDEVCADNRAFHDQMLALRWVQEHIAAFGGDPGCVTLFGQSAGAFACFQLAASPLARGLFKRVIALGGMAGTHAPVEDYHRLTRLVLEQHGIQVGDADALAALDRAGLQSLQKAISRAVFGKHSGRLGTLGRMKVGFLGAAVGTEFLPESTLPVYASGTPNDIDLMLGTCANDGGLFSLALPIGRTLSARIFSKNFLGLMPAGDLKSLYAHYRAQLRGETDLRVWEQLNNDSFYRVPTLDAAKAHATGHPGKTWHFQLDYRCPIGDLGSIHAMDVALIFNGGNLARMRHDDAETRALSAAMIEAFAQFAKTGKPHSPRLPAWTPYGTDNPATLVMNRQSRLVRALDPELLGYWNRRTA